MIGSAMIAPTFMRGFERAVRVPEDDLDPAPQHHQLSAFQLGDVDAVIEDRPGSGPLQPQNAPTRGRLAAATLADQPQCLAVLDRKVDPVDRLDLADLAMGDDPLGDREMHPKAPDFEERLCVDRSDGHGSLPVEPNR
jgi:hypothetical protein